MRFNNASNAEELKENLKKRSFQLPRIRNGKTVYLYHYTTVDAILGILKSKHWYIGSPSNMNDGVELGWVKKTDLLNNLFFSCFVSEENENIGMWSMYSQPWENGVVVKIPVESIKKWIKSNPQIYKVKSKLKEPSGIRVNATIILHNIAYTNAESVEERKEEKTFFTCGKQINTKLDWNNSKESLVGYVKDMAWSYEKEIRFRVETEEKNLEGVAVEIPQDVMDSFVFLTGPRFSDNLINRIRSEVDDQFDDKRQEASIFTGRLNGVYCDKCSKNANKDSKEG